MGNNLQMSVRPARTTKIDLFDSSKTNVSIKTPVATTVQRSTEHLNVEIRNTNNTRLDIRAPASIVVQDYNTLRNIPTINGVPVRGDLSYVDLFLAKESINTKEYWDSNLSYIPAYGEIVIYTDRTVVDNLPYPGIKIGDGDAYLVDLPFLGDEQHAQLASLINNHINNTDIHVTAAEKTFWNNKLNCDVDNGNLIFSRQ